jgi:HPt (histidine-containing phosphotransfer) domain-containing protein
MIDWTRVRELRDEIGNDGFAEVVELFLDEVEEVVMRLRATPDPRTLEQDLHFLTGCAWNLGFTAFGALCHQGERRVAQGMAASVDLAVVLAGYAAARAEFLAGLARLAQGLTPDAA